MDSNFQSPKEDRTNSADNRPPLLCEERASEFARLAAERRDSDPSVPGANCRKSTGDTGHQARNVSPVWLAKLHISRDGPERRLLRRLAGHGPN